MSERDLAISMIGITKAFSGTVVVDGVDFLLRKGEVHALLGENGAGKSTLVKVLAGEFDEYAGKVLCEGTEVFLHSPGAAIRHGIEMVRQELSLSLPQSIAENLLAGSLPRKMGVFVNGRRMAAMAAAALDRVGLDVDPSLPVDQLSPHQAQLVEIARVLARNPRVIILDEPTSALSRAEIDRLFELIRRLRTEGLAIVYISHHLSEVFAIADRATVLRDGRKVADLEIDKTNPNEIARLMVGHATSDGGPRRHFRASAVRFELSGFSRFGFFEDIGLKICEGEIVGIAGLAGSGRTELALSIVGLDPHDRGTLWFDGSERCFKSPGNALAKGIAYLPEDRKLLGLALGLSVEENLLAGPCAKPDAGFRLPKRRLRPKLRDLVQMLRVSPPDMQEAVAFLSGGNQQKVLLGKWLATEPKLLILDEPTRGVDIGAKEQIHRAVLELSRTGTSILIISSDLPELIFLSDRVHVMRKGRFVAELARDQMSEHAILLAAGQEVESRR